ncbi:MAG: DUF3185 family protein [bacterium]|nr:DUF3185 family protein [bacterium]MDT8395476.1 DUF3185 family protein [bacterium]
MIKRSMAIGCLVFGSVTLYIGYGKTQSVAGGLRRAFGSGYSTETIVYLVGGAVLVVTGLVMLTGRKKR